MPTLNTVSLESSGIASFTLVQVLLEKLVENSVLSKEDVRSIISQGIYLNERVIPEVKGRSNQDAAYLIKMIGESLELGWQESA